MKAHERFLNYIKFGTQSSEESGTHPSTDTQFGLAEALKEELSALGCTDITVTDNCYVYAKLPATEGYEKAARIGFIAHMDTAPDFCGENVNPIIIENYNGENITLGTSGRVIDTVTFPHLKSLAGRTLITTDGTTLLGADDKAGIAEIMTAISDIIADKTPHGGISIAFTPDEEIGEGADGFDVDLFGADFAFTVDGGAEGTLEYENFNAASATFMLHGVNVHPGSAKDTMINAALVAMEVNAALPCDAVPSKTEGYEGFFHLTDMKGTVECAKLHYIVRDHSAELFEEKQALLRKIEADINKKYGAGTAELLITESYRNMKEMITPHMHLIDNAKRAIEMAGMTPSVEPIRGGTDGARLSFMGLPCPNLGTGGHAFHGPFEHISVEGMDASVKIIKNIIAIYANSDIATGLQ